MILAADYSNLRTLITGGGDPSARLDVIASLWRCAVFAISKGEIFGLIRLWRFSRDNTLSYLAGGSRSYGGQSDCLLESTG